MDPTFLKEAKEIIHTWKTDAKINKNLHQASAKYYWKLNKAITIPLLAIMAISSTSLISAISLDNENDKSVLIFGSVLAAISTFIQTLQVFLDLEGKETTHKNTVRLYQLSLDEIEKFKIEATTFESVSNFIHHIDVLRKMATTIKYEPPKHVYKNYAKQLIQDDLINEIRKLAEENSPLTPNTPTSMFENNVISISNISNINTSDNILSSIEEDLNKRTNYWNGSIAISFQEAKQNISNIAKNHISNI
jgi:hypothetical protein